MAKICCVDGCSSSNERVFFNFPNSRTMRRKWMDVITTRKKLPDDSLVCSQHFLENQYEVFRGKTRLKAKVIPSLYVRVKTPDKPSMRNGSPIVNNTEENKTAKNDEINTLTYLNTIENSPCIDRPDNIVTDSNSGVASKNNKASTKKKLQKKKSKDKDKFKQNGVSSKEERSQELTDIENKDIEDIITNYHIKQTIPNMLHSPATDMGIIDHGGQDRILEDGEKDVVEINDNHTEPQFIEISADKGQDGQVDSQDCLMVLENVQVDVDPNLMFPDIGDEDSSSNDSDVVHIREKKEDPISLLTSSDEDEVIIEEPKIDTVEVSDETDEDDVPLVKLVKVKKKTKSKSKMSLDHINLFKLGGYEYYCIECHYTTNSQAEFKKHKKTHSTIIQVCHVCSFTTESRSQFLRHKRKHKHEKQYQCHICEYKAKHHMSLIYHLKTHNVDNTKCDRCGYTSSVKVDFLKHLKHCCVDKLYKCVVCTYQTWRRTHLKRHRLRAHQECDDDQHTDYTPG